MKSISNDLINRNKVFYWIALATGIILLIPLIGMQISHEVNWSIFDFMIAGTLIFATASLYVIAARKIPNHRLLLGAVIGAFFVYLWAELAVGIFTNWGS